MDIVVGFTGSLGGQDALSLGALLARSGSANMDVYMILNKDKPYALAAPEGGYDKMLREQAAEWIEDAEEELGLDDLVCHLHYAAHPADGLLEVCEKKHPACLIISGGRHGALGKVTLGSIGTSLIHSSPVPLALAPRGMRHRKIKKINRITACVGTLEGTERLLRSTVVAAREMDCDVRVLSLIELPVPGAKKEALISHKQAVQQLEKNLAYIKDNLPDDLHVTTEVAKGTSISDAVERIDWKEDEIVLLGSARLGAPTRLFLGNVANKILRAVPVPLIIVPRHDEDEVST
ncbi:MAG: universal stress protein [Actinomycetaceae bacterium]|nr:universal stress protein [Actinomycetaceae bacterium]